MLELALLLVALCLSGPINDRFLELDCFTPWRGALLLAALVVGPLYALSPWLTLLAVPYVSLLYITMPLDKKFCPSRRSKAMAANLPSPPTSVPYFGHAIQLASVTPEKLLNFLKGICDEFPKVPSLKILGTCYVLLRHPEDLEVLLGSMKNINKGPEYTMLMPWLREGLLTSSGQKWKTRRKLFTPTFHFKILENNVDSFNKNSRLLVQKMLETNGKPIEADKYIRLCTLDVIAETAMGISLNAQGNQNSAFIQAIHKATEIATIRMVNFWLFKEPIFYCTLVGLAFRRALQVLHEFSGEIIRERKRNISTSEVEESVPDKRSKPFLDCLIHLKSQNVDALTDIDIREEVDTFMFEGHDTTSSALNFSLLLLGNYPQAQETAFQEQREIFGDSDRPVTMADLKLMTYLERVIKEVLRLYPSVPLMTRFLTEDLTLTGNTIVPKSSVVLFSPYFTHRDPKHYPDPERFDPDRFSPENSRKRHPFAYIPFSAGPRNCIGQKFAMMELKTVLSTILRFTRIEAVTRVESVELMPHLILKPHRPIVIRAQSRQ